MGSLESGPPLKRERDNPLLRSSSSKPRSRLARIVLFGKFDYLQWVCAMGVFLFFIIICQMFLPGSRIENSVGSVMTWQMMGGLDFGEGVELEPTKVLSKFKKDFGGINVSDFSSRGVRIGSRKPLIALVFADLLIDPQQIQMVTVAVALKEIGYDIEVFALDNGVAGDVWAKVGFPVTIFKTVEMGEVVVDWLRYDGVIVNSIEAREAFSRLLQEPFKSVTVIWSLNDRTLSTHLREYKMDAQVELVKDWQKFFNRSTVVVFPNYALPMYYSSCDSGNYFVIPGSPSEAWEANNFMVSHKDNTGAIKKDEPNNFVVVIVGSLYMYKGLWLEHALVMKALLRLLPDFSFNRDSRSRLKVIILSGDSTGNYTMVVEAVASSLKYPKDIVSYSSADEDTILSMADLVIYGSFLEEHSFPSILVKAMSYGKPIVAPNLPMIRKYVDDRENGYLFPKENIEALARILKLAIPDGNLSPSAHEIASNGKRSAKNLMVSETVEGYAYLLENVLKLPSEVELPKPVTEIPGHLKEEWQWKLFESVSGSGSPNRTLKALNFLQKIEKHWNRTQTENSGASRATDETFFYSIWEEEKNIAMANAKRRREEDQLKDRTDQARGTWEEVYKNAKKADRLKNDLHERDDGELERTGQPLTIYEPYFGEGTWPFLHQNSLYRGLGLSTKGRRPRTDDIDAPSCLAILYNSYYRDALGEFGGFFAIANRVDRVHKNAWIGFQSWRATARKESLSKAAETAILEAIEARRHGDTLYFWARLDTDPRNPSNQDFWSFCDAINAGNCKLAYSEAMKKMYGLKDDEFSVPPMPVDGGTWSVMHSWALPTKSFLEFVMFSRMFIDALDAQFYNEHYQTGHCVLSLSKDKYCYSRVLELLVNMWAYHSARKMVYLNPETGALQEQHKLKSRRGKMWVKWFSYPVLKSMDEDLAEEFDSESPRRRWLWPNTGEVFWKGMFEKERHKRNQEKETKKRLRKEKLDRMSKRHGQKVIGKYIKPPPEEVVTVGGSRVNSTVAAVARVLR